ncbi:hypothetical protein CWATWH0402_4125 [Crocosphaera watsonii WH 0402]|uniref:Uncharacterized protein n=1 Tax=Crocosphaera watsonii WH 0402 TaxID=1284629 RepID=T2K0E4_CROWT|nr:hypothetical protein CWATWH0402_4125 [Crocosphaera watsonii WH 0402]
MTSPWGDGSATSEVNETRLVASVLFVWGGSVLTGLISVS